MTVSHAKSSSASSSWSRIGRWRAHCGKQSAQHSVFFLSQTGAALGFVTDSETLYSCLFQTKERAVTDRTQNTSNSVKHGADIGRGKVATEAGRSPREEEVQGIGSARCVSAPSRRVGDCWA